MSEEGGNNVDIHKLANENIVTLYVNEFTEQSFKDFRSDFLKAEQSGQTIIPIIIDSYGGCVETLLAMFDLMQSSKLPISTIATGKAMSCGAFLLSCGTKGLRYATSLASVMVHEVSSHAWGTNSDIQADAKEVERINGLVFNILDKNCDKALGYWKSQLKENNNADLYLTAEQAKSHGLVDVIGSPRIVADVKVETKLV